MSFLSDKEWKNLLRYIRDGQVIPIVGPGLSTVDTGSGPHLPIDRVIAPQLAGALGLEPDVTRHCSVNRVACDTCSGRARRARISMTKSENCLIIATMSRRRPSSTLPRSPTSIYSFLPALIPSSLKPSKRRVRGLFHTGAGCEPERQTCWSIITRSRSMSPQA